MRAGRRLRSINGIVAESFLVKSGYICYYIHKYRLREGRFRGRDEVEGKKAYF